MERRFGATAEEAAVIYDALRYYAGDLFQAFVDDEDAPLLDDALAAVDLAGRIQAWLVANRQTLVRDGGS